MAQQTRREFLENSMLAAVAVAGTRTATPLFAEEPQATSPNELLRVAVVGVNGRGAAHLAGFHPNAALPLDDVIDGDDVE